MRVSSFIRNPSWWLSSFVKRRTMRLPWKASLLDDLSSPGSLLLIYRINRRSLFALCHQIFPQEDCQGEGQADHLAARRCPSPYPPAGLQILPYHRGFCLRTLYKPPGADHADVCRHSARIDHFHQNFPWEGYQVEGPVDRLVVHRCLSPYLHAGLQILPYPRQTFLRRR